MDDSHIPDPSYEIRYRLVPELGQLRKVLAPLAIPHRLAFGLCCCERLYPRYLTLTAFLQVPDSLRLILNRLWQHIIGTQMTDSEIAQSRAACLSLSLGPEDCCAAYHDAVAAVDAAIATLDACRGFSLDYVVSAAECVRNTIDRALWLEQSALAGGVLDPEDVRRIDADISNHPLMVAERELETRQLRFLYECEQLREPEIAQLLLL